MDAQASSTLAAASLGQHTLSRSSSSSSLASSAPSVASSSSLRSRRSSNLTLDLSNLQTSSSTSASAPVPTNTLLFTNLMHADIFRPDNLETIRDLVSQSATIHSWAPLKSFRRIVASFYSAEDAARVRAVWEGERILGAACQVYYGRQTPLDNAANAAAKNLALPDAGKLFFISPPPSPPHDWEMRLEGAPNKQVHAEDLADALAKLRHQADEEVDTKMQEDLAMRSPESENGSSPTKTQAQPQRTGRSRSSTLVIYQPAEHSTHSDLPAIAVEDMTDANTDEELNSATWKASSSSPLTAEKPIMAHTARPPVELMQDA